MKISVVIPAYNAGKYIERCVDSVLSQTGAQMEVIVVNDGSKDNTLEVLEKYGDKIKVFTKENGGVANARSFGLSHVSGDRVMFVDSDDCLLEGAVAALVQIAANTDADLIHFRYEVVLPDGRTFVPKGQTGEEGYVTKDEFKRKVYPRFMDGIALNSVWSILYKRDVIEGLRFNADMKVAEDALFNIEAFTRAKDALFIPDVMYGYWQTGTGLTGSGAAIRQKYKDNFKLAAETVSRLGQWGMDTPFMRLKVFWRPIRLTFDKVRRVRAAR